MCLFFEFKNKSYFVLKYVSFIDKYIVFGVIWDNRIGNFFFGN